MSPADNPLLFAHAALPVRHVSGEPSAAQQLKLQDAADERLVQAILGGTRGSAAALYDCLCPSIEHALRRVLHHNNSEFEDLVQITFERVVRTIIEGRFEGRSRLSTWAGAIAAHVAMDLLRRRSRERRVFADGDTPGPEPMATTVIPERQLEARSEIKRLQGVLSRMKPELADILVLHDVLGHSIPSISRLYGIKLSKAQSRLGRARKDFVRRSSAKISGRSD